jgi:hypothetical protein
MRTWAWAWARAAASAASMSSLPPVLTLPAAGCPRGPGLGHPAQPEAYASCLHTYIPLSVGPRASASNSRKFPTATRAAGIRYPTQPACVGWVPPIYGTYSLFRQGCMYYQSMPMMPEAQLLLLVERFAQLVLEQPFFREIFGPI